MIKYEKTIEFDGDITSAIAKANEVFSSNGIEIHQSSSDKLILIGPGKIRGKENPIKALKRGELKFTDSTLEFSGELDGVEFMKKFLYIFPPALGVGLMIFFLSLAYFTKQDFSVSFTPLLTVAPWLILSPIMATWIHKSTEKSIKKALDKVTRK